MQLNSIVKVAGRLFSKKRRGCGPGSGLGKTCGRGQKGQKSRSGASIRPGFEGGQMPLYRKIPRRGFSNYKFRSSYQIVNLSQLDSLPELSIIDIETLFTHGLVRDLVTPVKILGNGPWTRKAVFRVSACSQAARQAILAKGGEIFEV